MGRTTSFPADQEPCAGRIDEVRRTQQPAPHRPGSRFRYGCATRGTCATASEARCTPELIGQRVATGRRGRPAGVVRAGRARQRTPAVALALPHAVDIRHDPCVGRRDETPRRTTCSTGPDGSGEKTLRDSHGHSVDERRRQACRRSVPGWCRRRVGGPVPRGCARGTDLGCIAVTRWAGPLGLTVTPFASAVMPGFRSGRLTTVTATSTSATRHSAVCGVQPPAGRRLSR